MSLNREHAIWQSSNKKWNIGFFDFVPINQDDDDFDPEWDVVYLSEFFWASTGYSSPDAAFASWKGANPGYQDSPVSYKGEDIEWCKKYTKMARQARIKA